ncbi:MAG: fibronectin type III domain-containing protein [bacterium]|nr:fibronectin type III domain-containing protein [bacterium]
MRARPSHALLAIALAGIVVAACGQKANPKPPELVHPGVPSSLTAASTPDGVQLTWRRPLRYSGGDRMNDLDYFAVERAPDSGGPFTEVTQVPVTDRDRFRKQRRITWTDGSAQAGTHYYYRVSAVTLDDYRSKPAGPLGITFDPRASPKKVVEAPDVVETPQPPPVIDFEDEDEGGEPAYSPGLGAVPGAIVPAEPETEAEEVDSDDTLDAADGVPTDDPDELPAE